MSNAIVRESRNDPFALEFFAELFASRGRSIRERNGWILPEGSQVPLRAHGFPAPSGSGGQLDVHVVLPDQRTIVESFGGVGARSLDGTPHWVRVLFGSHGVRGVCETLVDDEDWLDGRRAVEALVRPRPGVFTGVRCSFVLVATDGS